MKYVIMATPGIMKMESFCQTTMSYEVIAHLAMLRLSLFAQNETHFSDGHN
jgi:hypothetical protein